MIFDTQDENLGTGTTGPEPKNAGIHFEGMPASLEQGGLQNSAANEDLVIRILSIVMERMNPDKVLQEFDGQTFNYPGDTLVESIIMRGLLSFDVCATAESRNRFTTYILKLRDDFPAGSVSISIWQCGCWLLHGDHIVDSRGFDGSFWNRHCDAYQLDYCTHLFPTNC